MTDGGGRSGPLSDITVIEVANWVAGPSAGAILADLGANVIKVEPLDGDSMRGKLRQPIVEDGSAAEDVPFQLDNRGKRSIAVNLGDERGSALVRELVAKADVFITNLLPGRLERFGLGPEQWRESRPELIYALITGYGSAGPDADRIGFDLTAFFGRGSIMSLMADPSGEPPAFRPGQGDHPTGLALLSAILVALRVRDQTGQGQVVETALMRTAAWTIACDVAPALVDKRQPSLRARKQAISPMNTRYRCADGVWVNLATLNQFLWDKLCAAIERPDLVEDERFATPAARFRNNCEIIGLLDEEFAKRRFDEWVAPLDATGIIWGKVAELPDLIEDPSARAMEMFVEVSDERTGDRFETLAAPFAMSSSEVRVRGRGPGIGEHTNEVLAEMGISPHRIAALQDGAVIRTEAITPPAP
ncbi:MAG: CaiB/BaiF CoA transferase family protein [Acidimicrobiales bacterium]